MKKLILPTFFLSTFLFVIQIFSQENYPVTDTVNVQILDTGSTVVIIGERFGPAEFIALRERDFILSLDLGSAFYFFTGAFDKLFFSEESQFQIGVEASYQNLYGRIEISPHEMKVKNSFVYKGIWNNGLPLDGGELSIATGYRINLPYEFCLKPAITYALMNISTDDRVKEYTGEDRSVLLDYVGFIAPIEWRQKTIIRYSYFFRLSGNIFFPLHNKSMFDGSIYRINFSIGIEGP